MLERVRLVGAVLVRDGRILLGRRSPRKQICPGLWDVIGDHVEAQETYEDALRRELWEELRVSPTSFRMIGERQLTTHAEIRIYRPPKRSAHAGGVPSAISPASYA